MRPERLSSIVGQDRIVITLKNQIKTGHVSHAYLFCGSRGTGKTTAAKALARAINCESPIEGDLCGACATCELLKNENNLDVIEIDAASNNGVDEIRDLREKIKYPPTVGKYKVYIVDEVHMLSSGAFNALLKTLEEPPSHAVFILATTEPHRLPATILSRCQRFDFKRIPARLIEGVLEKVAAECGADFESGAISIIAAAAEGGLRDALSNLDMCLSYTGGRLTEAGVRDVLGAVGRETLFSFADALSTCDVRTALNIIDQIMRDGRDSLVFTREVTNHLRGLLIALACGEGAGDILEVTREDAARLIEQSQKTSEARLLRQMSLFIKVENDMKWLSSPRTALELCAVRACHPEREATFEALEERIAHLEQVIKTPVAITREEVTTVEDIKPPQEAVVKAPEDQPMLIFGGDMAFQRAMKLLSKQSVNTFVMLKKGKFADETEDEALIEFAPADSLFIDILSNNEKRAVIDACLSEAFGRPLRAVFTKAGSLKKPADKVNRRGLEQVFEMFPREKVEVVDNLTGGQ
jgi:DNA polymerase-3 subunit gamma/tau